MADKTEFNTFIQLHKRPYFHRIFKISFICVFIWYPSHFLLMKYKIIILFPFETYRIENCFKRFVYKKVYNRVDIRVVFYTIVHRSSLIIHLPISFCFFRQLGHTFASLGISVLQCLHNFVSFLFSFSIVFFPIFLSFLGKYFRTALFWNEIKYASRILLVIAAVAKFILICLMIE